MGVTRHQRLPERLRAKSSRPPELAVSVSTIAALRRCAGIILSEDDHIRRAVISRLLCHTVIPKKEIDAEFGIDFDSYFASELQHLPDTSGRWPFASYRR